MRQTGGRHELKHYINYADFIQLRARLACVAKHDENSKDSDGYSVRSLYFDNYSDKALREKLDGMDEREKFRLRLYSGDTSFIRLEKKSKKNGICFKQKAVITAAECGRLLSGDWAVLKENGDKLCLELYAKMHFQMIKPKNIVEYKREAYIFPAGNVRITIDREIRASSDISQFLNEEILSIPTPRTIILEVKYDHFLPELIREIISLQSRQVTAFSKYAIARFV